ncbi:MAG TPA: hypothetical protein PLM59_06195 [Oscillospiraceae bacterium]|jgi:hypothetical protein|nr:hypothetical protein [Oscillospiraceae bacterium]HOV41364.1 hypothetical protein [Oscillospiraceae bacterium]
MNSYLNPDLRAYFEMLPIEAKNYILQSGVSINTLEDLLKCVDEMLEEK